MRSILSQADAESWIGPEPMYNKSKDRKAYVCIYGNLHRVVVFCSNTVMAGSRS